MNILYVMNYLTLRWLDCDLDAIVITFFLHAFASAREVLDAQNPCGKFFLQ